MCHLLPPGRPEDHDTGLERRTILYELVGFVFVKTTQVRDDYRNKKGQGSNTMAPIPRQAPSITLTFVCSLLPGISQHHPTLLDLERVKELTCFV